MNTRERFNAVMNFEQPDRNLLWEMGYWPDTLERWYGEGLTRKGNQLGSQPGAGIRGEASPHDESSPTRFRDRDVHGALGLDPGLINLPVNSGPEPLFCQDVFEDTGEYLVYQDEYGVKKRVTKDGASVPEFIGWQVESRKDFERLKEERFQPRLADRVPQDWAQRVQAYRERDYPLSIGGYPFGFYGFLRYLLGEERLLLGFYDDPGLIKEIMGFLADFWIELWDQALGEVQVDCAHFWEDMAYRTGPLISPATFREFMTPCYRKVTGFLKERGVKVILVDSDGNLDELIPLFLEAGLTGIWPVEVQAGNDLAEIRRCYPKLRILGGIDKLKIARGREAIDRELEEKMPYMLGRGGYIPLLDHLAHPEISWPDFRYYRNRLKEYIEKQAGTGK
jgi:uroporphyrinogen decarboxylase